MKRILTFLALLGATQLFAQFNTGTITLDGAANEAAYVTSGAYSIAWDDTYLYVRYSGGGATEPVILHIDTDPQTIVNGGGNSNGNLTGNTNWGITPNLPFRSNFMIYWESQYAEYRTSNGAGGWNTNVAITTTDRSNASGPEREIRLSWTSMMGLAGRPTAFNFTAFANSRATPGFIFNQTPSENPSGASGTPTLNYYWTVSSTANGTATSPFSRKSFAANSAVSIGAANTFYDVTVNGGVTTLGAGITINNALRVPSGDVRSSGGRTVTMDGTTTTIDISGGSITGTDAGTNNDITLNITSGTTTLTGVATSTNDNDKKFFNVTVANGATLALSRGILCRYGTFSCNGTLQINANGYVSNIETQSRSANYGTTGSLVYNNGGPFTIGNEWPAANSPINVTLQNSSSLTLTGDRTISGTLALNGSLLDITTYSLTLNSLTRTSGNIDADGGTLVFANTAPLTLPVSAFTGNLNHLILNGSGGVTLSENMTVIGNLTLTNGLVTLGSFNLTVSSGTINGGSSSSFIVTNGLGVLNRMVASSGSIYPIGYNSSNYRPVTLTAAVAGSNPTYGLRVGTRFISTGSGQNWVQLLWKVLRVSEPVATSIDINPQWAAADESSTLGSTIYSYLSLNDGASYAQVTSSSKSGAGPFSTTFTIPSTENGLIALSDFSLPTVLPVELVAFSGAKAQGQNRLTWTTASESKMAYFEVERSANGVSNWQFVAQVKAENAANGHTYTAYDATPLALSYYRLKMVENNGDVRFSKIVSVAHQSNNPWAVYPNPVSKTLFVDMTTDSDQTALLQVFDMAGRLHTTVPTRLTAGNNVIGIETELWPSGLYLVKWGTQIVKFTKE